MSDSSSIDFTSSLLEKYSEKEVYKLLYKDLGYQEEVPTIDEFIESDEYLGLVTVQGTNIYSYWREVLRDIYPTPFSTRYHTIFLRGAIGIGKSVVGRIGAAYNLMKMLKLSNPRKKFKLLPTQTIEMFAFAADLTLIDAVFMNEFTSWITQSPFFKQYLNTTGNTIFRNNVNITKGSSITHNVGRAIFCAVFEEIQREIRHNQLEDNYNSIIMRLQSRFETDEGLYGQVFLIGSAGASQSFSEKLTEKSREDSGILILEPPQWAVLANNPEKGIIGKRTYCGETFNLYTGDDTRDPFILEKDDPLLTSILEEEKILKVPVEYFDKFEADIYQAIRDIAGITTRAQFRFFQSLVKVNACMNKENWFNQDIVKVSFYNQTDKLIDKLVKEKLLNRVNKNAPRYIHCDLAYAGDLCGVACCHIAGFNKVKRVNPFNNEEKWTNEPIIIVDFVIGVDRFPGVTNKINRSCSYRNVA